MVGWGWVLLIGVGCSGGPRSARPWAAGMGTYVLTLVVREGVGGCQGRCGGRGRRGDGGPQGAHLREGRSASKALLGEVYSIDEVDTAIAALECRIPGKDAVRVGLKLG